METGNDNILKEDISKYIERLKGQFGEISPDKKNRLNDVILYLRSKLRSKSKTGILFISPNDESLAHIGQIWAKTISLSHNLQLVEISTASLNGYEINREALTAIRNYGFDIRKIKSGANPIYSVSYSETKPAIKLHSRPLKTYEEPDSGYVALIINQDEWQTPFIRHAEFRLPLDYEMDSQESEDRKYDRLCHLIGLDMYFIFSGLKDQG